MKSLALIIALSLGAMSAFAAPGDRDRDIGASASMRANQTQIEESALWKKLSDQLSLSYYVSLMGPTITGPVNETYNVFLEGRAPLQLFHSFNLRWQFDPKWAVGVTLAGVQNFTSPVKSKGYTNDNTRELFNTRAYLAVPSVDFGQLVTMFNTFAIEFPTTPGSVDDQMKYGLVLSQTLSFKPIPAPWAAGWLTQLIRYKYERATLPPPFVGGRPTPLQTTLITTGPYLNYQIAPQWQFASLISFDWDQRGKQTDTLRFNNNLPDRARMAINYFFQTKPFTHIGLYTQVLTQYTSDTQIVGLDFSLKF